MPIFAEWTADGNQTRSPFFGLFDATESDGQASLQRAVMISLFTDRRAEPSDEIPDGADDRRGWWADGFESDTAANGSRLWLLDRGKVTAATVAAARDYADEALRWLVVDGLAARVVVETERQGATIAMRVQVIRRTGSVVELRFDDLWGVLDA